MSDVEKLKVNGDILDIADIRMRNVVGGDEYDAVSGTYAVGDRCIYNNIMRECVTAVETPEAFDSEKWVNTTIDEVCSSLNSSLANKLLIGRSTITGDNTTNKASKVIDITATNPNGLAIKGVLLQWLDTDNIVTYADYLNVVTYSATSLTISTKWRTANNYSWQFEYVLIT